MANDKAGGSTARSAAALQKGQVIVAVLTVGSKIIRVRVCDPHAKISPTFLDEDMVTEYLFQRLQLNFHSSSLQAEALAWRPSLVEH